MTAGGPLGVAAAASAPVFAVARAVMPNISASLSSLRSPCDVSGSYSHASSSSATGAAFVVAASRSGAAASSRPSRVSRLSRAPLVLHRRVHHLLQPRVIAAVTVARLARTAPRPFASSSSTRDADAAAAKSNRRRRRRRRRRATARRRARRGRHRFRFVSFAFVSFDSVMRRARSEVKRRAVEFWFVLVRRAAPRRLGAVGNVFVRKIRTVGVV